MLDGLGNFVFCFVNFVEVGKTFHPIPMTHHDASTGLVHFPFILRINSNIHVGQNASPMDVMGLIPKKYENMNTQMIRR